MTTIKGAPMPGPTLKSTELITRGGPNIDKLLGHFVNSTSNKPGGSDVVWSKSDDLVVLSRSGDLTSAIVGTYVSGNSHLHDRKTSLSESIKNAILAYFENNVKQICEKDTKAGSRGQAEDTKATCVSPDHKYSCYGMYVKCQNQYQSEHSTCRNVNNPIHGQLKCPRGSDEVLVAKEADAWKTGARRYDLSDPDLTPQNKLVLKEINSANIYCQGKAPIQARTGLLFGGMYNKHRANPRTGI